MDKNRDHHVVGIMQPYFMPYIGYWQLLNCVDTFVIYDNIEFEKNGWIRRNRILVNNEPKMISLPLKKDSDYLDVVQRYLADDFHIQGDKILRQVQSAYRKAPHYDEVMEVLDRIFKYNSKNLFEFIYNSVREVTNYLGIQTKIVVSSNINIDPLLKCQDKVIAICKELGASDYINPIGGKELYSYTQFDNVNIKLHFLKSNLSKYKQWGDEFVPSLSIIDVMMFNSREQIREMLNEYTLE